MGRIDNETVRYFFHIQIQRGEQPPQPREPRPEPPRHQPPSAAAAVASAAARASEPPHLPGFAREMERSEEHTSELQSLAYLVCRLLLEKKKHVLSSRVGGRQRPRQAHKYRRRLRHILTNAAGRT